MSCKLNTGDICWPRRNDGRITITFYSNANQLIDVSGASEITFIVARTVKGPVLITKTLTSGAITLATNSQGFFLLTDLETDLVGKDYYYECRITNASGDLQTVAAGAFVIQETLIGA